MSSSEFYNLLYGNLIIPKMTPVPKMPEIFQNAENNPICDFRIDKV